MQFRFQNLAPLCRSIRHNRKSIEQFEIIYYENGSVNISRGLEKLM